MRLDVHDQNRQSCGAPAQPQISTQNVHSHTCVCRATTAKLPACWIGVVCAGHAVAWASCPAPSSRTLRRCPPPTSKKREHPHIWHLLASGEHHNTAWCTLGAPQIGRWCARRPGGQHAAHAPGLRVQWQHRTTWAKKICGAPSVSRVVLGAHCPPAAHEAGVAQGGTCPVQVEGGPQRSVQQPGGWGVGWLAACVASPCTREPGGWACGEA